eukprot:9492719-Pyramimonas_sp.AAC.1
MVPAVVVKRRAAQRRGASARRAAHRCGTGGNARPAGARQGQTGARRRAAQRCPAKSRLGGQRRSALNSALSSR